MSTETWAQLKDRQREERRAFLAAIAATGATKAQTARQFGVTLPAVIRLADRYGIEFVQTRQGAYSAKHYAGWK